MTVIDKRIICRKCGRVLEKGDKKYVANGKTYCEGCYKNFYGTTTHRLEKRFGDKPVKTTPNKKYIQL
jgi:hypothetical protein